MGAHPRISDEYFDGRPKKLVKWAEAVKPKVEIIAPLPSSD